MEAVVLQYLCNYHLRNSAPEKRVQSKFSANIRLKFKVLNWKSKVRGGGIGSKSRIEVVKFIQKIQCMCGGGGRCIWTKNRSYCEIIESK